MNPPASFAAPSPAPHANAQTSPALSAVRPRRRARTPTADPPKPANLPRAANPAELAKARARCCSACGKPGHNVRRCPELPRDFFYKQRCGRCGGVGHNARNCPESRPDTGRRAAVCETCGGAQKLVCRSCAGSGFAKGAAPVVSGVLPEADGEVSHRNKKLVEAVRARAKLHLSMQRRKSGTLFESESVGMGTNAGLMQNGDFCPVCRGAGYLACMSCE